MSDQNPSPNSGQAQTPNSGQAHNPSADSAGSQQTQSGQAQDPANAGDFTPLPDEQAGQSAGQPLAQVATQQIAISKEDLEKFGIDEAYAKKNPVLVNLILKTESMKDEERKYWFQLLPIMSDEQVQKLQGILQNEKDQLAELDKKYEAEVAKLNADQPSWDPGKSAEKRKKLEEEEKSQQQEEESDEADLLNQIENL